MKYYEFVHNYPVIDIIIYRNNLVKKVKCIIDTGSPYTIIPDKFLKSFHLSEKDEFTTIEISSLLERIKQGIAGVLQGVWPTPKDQTEGYLLIR